jgi:hypothetical protein
LKYKLKVKVIKSVFSSLTALLTLATLITGATLFQTTLAQPMMGESNTGMGNGGGAGGVNFNNPMSFANNIFNASSLYGSVGISMVNGVKVTSISVLENNEISVTLRHSAAATPSSKAATAGNNVNASTTISSSSLPQRVTVTAIRIPMNLKDLLALASQSSKMANNNSSTNTNNQFMTGSMQGFGSAANNNNNTNSLNNINPLSFITKLQIGSSSTMANADWKLPQTVRMGLTGMMGNNENNMPTTPSTADFIIVSVIPYTGKSTMTSPAG